METSGIDRLLSFANELGGVRAARDRASAPRAESTPSLSPSRSLETDGVKLTLSTLASSPPPGGADGAALPPQSDAALPVEVAARNDRPDATDEARERPANARNRAAFSAYERVRASDLGERIRIKA